MESDFIPSNRDTARARSHGVLPGCKTGRGLNHYRAPDALAPLAWVRGPSRYSAVKPTEKVADSYYRRPNGICRI